MSTTISAPGKVLIAGGYLVLDRTYSGLVVSTSSRFYTSVKSGGRSSNTIIVRSPLFKEATWNYVVQSGSSNAPVISASPDDLSKNKFVQLAVDKTIAVAFEAKGTAVLDVLSKGIDITIVGDNDFYSQNAQLAELGLPRSFKSLDKLKPFAFTGVSLAEVHKTGLGSSAALITSLVTALLVHFDVIPKTSLSREHTEGKYLAHNLAQYVHCLAQGKVGSGFDVSAAVFGSHLYTRFNPAVIESALGDAKAQELLPIVAPSNSAWNYRVQNFKLPPLTRILLADVDAGSDTPSLVGKILKWRAASSQEAHSLWTALDQENQSLAETLLAISALYEKNPEAYTSAIKYLSSLQSVQWIPHPGIPPEEKEVLSAYVKVHTTTQKIREHMRTMGELAEVPVEPPEQTELLDTCISLAGVVGGGVPGAGGYDAIWLLALDPVTADPDEPPVDRVDRTWSRYETLKVTPLSAKESFESGVRMEDPSSVRGLQDVINA